MFGLLLAIADRVQVGNTGLMPDEVRRLMALKPKDSADVIVRLSRLECAEVQDDCGDDLDAALDCVASARCENERIYFALRVLMMVHPILDCREWRDFLGVLKN